MDQGSGLWIPQQEKTRCAVLVPKGVYAPAETPAHAAEALSLTAQAWQCAYMVTLLFGINFRESMFLAVCSIQFKRTRGLFPC